MRPFPSALQVALGLAFLAGCGRNLTPNAQNEPVSVVPSWLYAFQAGTLPAQGIRFAASKLRGGVYAAQFYGSDLLGYRSPDKDNAGPVCDIAAPSVNGFAVDRAGVLVLPNGDPTSVSIYRGHTLCGKSMGTFSDPYGQASDAASDDATSGTIVVANIQVSDKDKVGNIAVCTLAKGCTRELRSKSIKYYGGGVALARNGDCWITSENNAALSSATLTYFKKCSGSGEAAKGWKNAYYGGLIIDKHGDLLSVDFDSAALWVYKGCNPHCAVVAGPLALKGNSFYGSLDAKGTRLVLGDWQLGEIDVYDYKRTRLSYLYSFSAGLSPSNDVEAAAFSPSL